jgi:hypothetical protein
MRGQGVILGIAREVTPEESKRLQAVAFVIFHCLGQNAINTSISTGAFSASEPVEVLASPIGGPVDDAALLRIQIGQTTLLDQPF